MRMNGYIILISSSHIEFVMPLTTPSTISKNSFDTSCMIPSSRSHSKQVWVSVLYLLFFSDVVFYVGMMVD